MPIKSSVPKPEITYAALVGRVLAATRVQRGVKQADMAAKLNVTQSAYSRLEAGASVLNVSQLRMASIALGLEPNALINQADTVEKQLKRQGVQIVHEKDTSAAAIAIGLALLAALLLGA